MNDGQPYKMLVARMLRSLEKDKLVIKERGRYVLTRKGEEEIEH
jgi:Mn-dependent DtxR family transcriptional regulator